MNIASLIQGIAVLAWLVVLAIVALVIFRSVRNKPLHRGGLWILCSMAFAVVISFTAMGLVFVNPQERGVVMSAFAPTGYREKPLEPGLRWILPFAESVVMYPISSQTYTMSVAKTEGDVQGDDSIAARTLDGQEIFVDASVIYSVDPAQVIKVHIAWQNRYSDDLVRPQVRGIIRDAVSQYGVQDVVSTKRFVLVDDIRKQLKEKLESNGLILIDFVLRNITFSPEYAASVEQKQIAEQQAQQAKFVVESKRQEAEQARQTAQGAADAAVIDAQGAAKSRLIQAEAEAKALEMIAEVLKNNPEMMNYQYITKLAPNVQVIYLPSNQSFMLQLPQTSGLGASSTTETLPTPTQIVPTPTQISPTPTTVP
jgi:regulator of protease activity HflC (stomatin/prohibitin superfamily)